MTGLSSLRSAVTGILRITGSPAWATVAGWTGIVLAVVALYAAMGFELEDARHRTVLPLLRRRAGRTAMDGDVEAQLSTLANEAGVRNQL
jgi:hypothetical protein